MLERNTLVAVIQGIIDNADANPDNASLQRSLEFLRGQEMLGKSPRVSWNLVRLFGGDVENGLRELLPDHDWSLLRTRNQDLSGKVSAVL